MKNHLSTNPGLLSTASVLCAALSVGAPLASFAAENFERVHTFDATTFVPPSLQQGPNHTLARRVENDGYMNHFTIRSRFGDFTADSNAELRLRVDELNAVARMEELSRTEGFLNAVGEGGANVIKGAGNLLTNPLGTIEGTFRGVGKLFERAGNTLSGEGDPGGPMKETQKRKYAQEFGVDVYSTNSAVQEQLDRLASASVLGGITASAGLMFVPGGAGVAVSVSTGTNTMNEINTAMPPSELRKLNRKRLGNMGVSGDLADVFLTDGALTPTRQTLIVDALSNMSTTADRDRFVKFSVHNETDDVALFRQRQIQMFAAYHGKVEPLKRFVTPGNAFIAGQAASGTLVFLAPLDHLMWTRAMATIVDSATAAAGDVPKQLWLTGTVSDTARKALASRGWQLKESAGLIPVW